MQAPVSQLVNHEIHINIHYRLILPPPLVLPHAAACFGSFTILPSAPLSRAAFAASTLAGVMPNHFSASTGRTSSR